MMAKFLFLSDKKLNIGLHLIAWAIAIVIPFYLTKVFDSGDNQRLYQFYVHTFSAIVIFYVGYIWLVPQFFLRDRKLIYVVILSGLILVTYFATSFINDTLLFDPVREAQFHEALRKAFGDAAMKKPPVKAFGFYYHMLSSILISGFAIGLGVMEKLKENEKKQKELEKEKLNSELAFLKNQVSPHFFFNTLNNIYSLIGLDASMAQDSVLKLSKLMRYLLYESENGETLVSKEIEFMNNYIDLMKLRLSPKVELRVEFPEEFADCQVPPLLFIPFIENAFKHGVSYRDRSFIDIRMTIIPGQIQFQSENSVGKSSTSDDLQHSGIGLENVKKRLNLLFPNRHELTIDKHDTVFRVNLSIQTEKTKL
jgi:sensor histidine kinase YesM